MANIEEYNASIDAIKAIPDAEVKYPGIPIEVYIQEAENLHHWCQDDKAALEAAGLDWEVVDAISVRAGATRETQSIVVDVYFLVYWFTNIIIFVILFLNALCFVIT